VSVGTPAQEPLNLNRTPTGAFADPRVEEYAQRRAQGSPPNEAAIHCGFGRPLTSRLEQTQELKYRLEAIKSSKAERLSLKWIVSELMTNVHAGRCERSVKSSTDALVKLYEIWCAHKEELDKATSAEIEKATADQRRGALRGRLSVIGGDNGQHLAPDSADEDDEED
jgi:hypothetical protein